jgi:hypothetical protein
MGAKPKQAYVVVLLKNGRGVIHFVWETDDGRIAREDLLKRLDLLDLSLLDG